MITNTSMTLYHKMPNNKTKIDEWKRSTILKIDDETGVMWQGGKGASLNKGYEQANDVRVWIPLEVNDLSDISIDIGDIIVKGDIDKEITKQSDLQDIDNVYNITTYILNDFSSTDMNHIELGGK